MRTSFMASLGITRAKEACRTAGRLWMAFVPSGHLRCAHLALGLNAFRDSAAEESDRRAATALLGCDMATFWGLDLESAEADWRAAEARREDSSLDIIVVALMGVQSGDVVGRRELTR